MAVTDTCAEYFVLPVCVGTTILQRNAICLCILAQLISCGHIVFLEDVVKGYITIISHIDLVFSTFLGRDDDHTIGSLRTVDGSSGGITEHVDALDIIGRDDRDVNTRNTVYYIVRRHGTRTQCRSTTQCDSGRTVRVGCR